VKILLESIRDFVTGFFKDRENNEGTITKS